MVDPDKATTGIEPVFASYRPCGISGAAWDQGAASVARAAREAVRNIEWFGKDEA